MFDLVAFIPRAIMQSIPLLMGSTGETLTEKSGNLNLGIPGIMYVGAMSGVIGAFLYEQSVPDGAGLNSFLAICIPLVFSLIGSLLISVVAILPIVYSQITNATGAQMNIALGGTSVIILVGVALETVRQLESQLMVRQYKGFLS